jgi:hypothetical protein
MEDNSKKTNGVDAYSDAPLFSKAVADQAVRFVAKLSRLTREVNKKLTTAINGKNNVIRTNSVSDADKIIKVLVAETNDWHEVIDSMKLGKDIHREENCKSHKLEIVGNRGYNEFGQYLVDRSSPKFTELNSDGKKYIKKVTANDI